MEAVETIKDILVLLILIASISCIKDCVRLIKKLTDKKGGKK